MPSDVHHRVYQRDKYSAKDYYVLMKTLQTTLVCESSDIAEFRLHTIRHYYRFGLRSTLDAFKIKKSTFYDWKHAYEKSRKNAGSLIPCSTAPHHVRRMHTDWRLIEFIKQMRRDYGNVGSNIIKPFLNAYAQKIGISSIGLTTIGKLVKRRGFTFEEKVYIPRKFKFKKLRTRKSPRVSKPGFIQMDSIVVYINYERHLFMSIMDIYTKFALVEYVENLSASTARRIFLLFQKINPTPIAIMQTDNGSEFLGAFHKEMEQQRITHQFIYPRMCKINGVIERFNRTVQEECILRNDEIYYDVSAFKEKLVKYLSWYNYQRPHSSLHYVSPMTFINTMIPKSG